MSKWLLSSIVVGGLCTWALAAAPKPSNPVDKALKERYPDAKIQIQRTREVNGVKVTDAKVTTKDGESTAEVTEYGDFLLWGLPRQGGMGGVAKPAADTINGLFKGSPSDVDQFWATDYLVDLGLGNKTFRLRFDPVGHLRDIDSSAAMKEESVQSMNKASKDEADKAEGYASKSFPGAKVNNVYKTDDPDFYLVDLTNKEGKDVQVVLSNNDKVLRQRKVVDKSELPDPVEKAIDRLFNGEKIKKVYRDEFQFYEIDQKDAAGDTITVRVRPNGDVLNIRNAKAVEEEKAQTARHKESAKNSRGKSD